MKPYPAYKPSGVQWMGEVPAHWDVKKVKHVARHTTGWTPPTGNASSYPIDGGNSWANIGDLGASVITETQNNISDEAARLAGITPSPVGSLLFSFKLSVGQVSVVGVPLYTNEAIATFLPTDEFSIGWAFYAFPAFIPENSAINIYGARLLNQQRINDAVLVVPSLAQQEAIAAYLDRETARIDTLIAEKGRLIETLREFSRSTFVGEFVTQAASGINAHPRIEWLPAIPSDWTCCKIKHIVESFDQGVSPQCEARPPEGDEWGVLKVGCVNTGLFDPQESKALPTDLPTFDEITLREGDVMISRANTRNLVGRCAAADKAYPRLMLSDKVYRLRIDRQRCAPAFLVDLLALPLIRQRIEERATGASVSMLNIDRRTILELDIVLPPLDVQHAIVQQIQGERQGISKLVEHVASEIALLRELRAATITDAVTGKIQVA